jgi:hypothetical protein
MDYEEGTYRLAAEVLDQENSERAYRFPIRALLHLHINLDVVFVVELRFGPASLRYLVNFSCLSRLPIPPNLLESN